MSTFHRSPVRHALALSVCLAIAFLTSACGTSSAADQDPVLRVGAIPDQDPEVLQRLNDKLSQRLADELDVEVEYVPVTDYTAAVTAFRVGDLDLVWFGGLTGVQAQLQVPDAEPIAQRDIDAVFRSVFIATKASRIEPFDDTAGLRALAGHTFTFGSETSTSGRLMPQFFLAEAGLAPTDFRGEAGFSGSHDSTVALVEAASYDAGVLNEQVWEDRMADGSVDLDKVQEVWRTPTYHDYHWVARPDVDERFGDGFTDRIRDTLLALDPENKEDGEILELFGAKRFIPTKASNYQDIEKIGREVGLVR